MAVTFRGSNEEIGFAYVDDLLIIGNPDFLEGDCVIMVTA